LHMPWMLVSFVPDLVLLLRAPLGPLRAQAYKLVFRYLHYSPRDAGAVIPYYLLCLDDMDDDVQRDAVRHAPDIFPLCQGQVGYFLHKLFRLVPGQEVTAVLLAILQAGD